MKFAANTCDQVWGSFLSIYLTRGWIWGHPRLVFSCLSVLLDHCGSCLPWSSCDCLRWLQSWDWGLACSFTHLSKQCWERKWSFSFSDSWWHHFIRCLIPTTIPWSNFNDLSWTPKFSSVRSGLRKQKFRKVRAGHRLPTKWWRPTAVWSCVIATCHSRVTAFSLY